jgi:hypothetical protein
MGRGSITLLTAVCLLWAASDCSAQDSDAPVLPSHGVGAAVVYAAQDGATDWTQRLAEARRWVADFTSWQQWDAAWHNTPEPGWFHARPRRQRPAPPAWLAGECADAPLDEGPLVSACRALNEWSDDAVVAELRHEAMRARAQQEAPTKSLWWEHIHLDGLWAMPQWSSGVFGLVGMHASVDVAGRLQVFVAPGAIVLNLPNGRGSREWHPATDWGIGYRIVNFTIPRTDQRASLHLNLAKAWVLADPIGAFPSTVDLVGLSMTFKR